MSPAFLLELRKSVLFGLKFREEEVKSGSNGDEEECPAKLSFNVVSYIFSSQFLDFTIPGKQRLH